MESPPMAAAEAADADDAGLQAAVNGRRRGG